MLNMKARQPVTPIALDAASPDAATAEHQWADFQRSTIERPAGEAAEEQVRSNI
jgi:hypothetical protein